MVHDAFSERQQQQGGMTGIASPWPKMLGDASPHPPPSPLTPLLKVMEIGVIRKLRYGFLLVFYSNYGDVLYRLRDIATCWYKIAKFYNPPVFSAPAGGMTPSEFCENV